jgi:hypothetical protein
MPSEKPFRSRFGPILRSISATLVVTFLLQDFAQAQGNQPLWTHVTQAAESTKKDSQDKLSSIAIPYDSGLTRKAVARGTEEIIINIQDAHSKLGAQESIARILDNLVKNYNLNLVALEGSSGVVDTSLIGTFPIESVREKTGRYLMKEGQISAAEFYSILSKDKISLYGVEDPDLYKGNVEAFRELVEQKPAIRRNLAALKKAVLSLEASLYSEELKRLSDERLLKKNGDVKFTRYWQFASALAQQKGVDWKAYPNLKKLPTPSSWKKRSTSAAPDWSATGSSRSWARSCPKRSWRSSSWPRSSSSRIRPPPERSTTTSPRSPRAPASIP